MYNVGQETEQNFTCLAKKFADRTSKCYLIAEVDWLLILLYLTGNFLS
jgi:hypothetical protein